MDERKTTTGVVTVEKEDVVARCSLYILEETVHVQAGGLTPGFTGYLHTHVTMFTIAVDFAPFSHDRGRILCTAGRIELVMFTSLSETVIFMLSSAYSRKA